MIQSRKLHDPYGRRIGLLRISILDRCNLRCIYCLPEQRTKRSPLDRLLRRSELVEVAEAARDLGISRIRLTGGEPLLRPDVVAITRSLVAIDGIASVAMTTNGSRLVEQASRLKKAGLSRVNVSLDSFDPNTYRHITQGGDLETSLEGIRAARTAGLSVRINAVLIEGVNDDELDDFVSFSRENSVEVRFIERMSADNLPYVAERRVIERLGRHHRVTPLAPDRPGGHVRRFACDGVVIGFISPRSRSFCAGCNKLRLTAAGKIRACLSTGAHVDVRSVLRGPHTRRDIRRALRHGAGLKPASGPWDTRLEMWRVGG